MFSGDSNGLSDGIIWITILWAAGTLIFAILKLISTWRRANQYRRLMPKTSEPAVVGETIENWASLTTLPLLSEFRRLLVTTSVSESDSRRLYRRVGDSEEVFNERSLARGLINNRFILATPGIVTGLGVLGTFVGLQLGIGGLDLRGSPDFKADSFNDAAALVATIQSKSDPVSSLLWSKFPDTTKSAFAASEGTESGEVLLKALNDLLSDRSLLESSDFDTIKHSPAPHKDEVSDSNEADIRWSVRLLLQDTYPNRIKKPVSSQDLDRSITPLIQGSAVAFSTSVWGVICSLIFSLLEKGVEGLARWRIRGLQIYANRYIPRYTAEESLMSLAESAKSSDNELKGLAGAIGEHMQQAIARIGERIGKEVFKGSEDLGKVSAELLAKAITDQLKTLGDTVDGMAQRFETQFSGVSKTLNQSVESFQPVVEKLNILVENSVRSVAEAVEKLSCHEDVMREMARSVQQLSGTAIALEAWKSSVERSAERNKEAAQAQERAAESNIRAADELSRIGDKLPEVRETIEQAAKMMISLGTPLLEFKEIVTKLPGITAVVGGDLKIQGKDFSDTLLRTSNDLAEKVGFAAAEFGKVAGLADKLADAAEALHKASSRLENFGGSVEQAAEKHRLSASASERAATLNESVADKLGPLPASLTQLSNGLATAGDAIRRGAETAQQSYKDAASAQEIWLSGISIKLEGMKARVQELIQAYSVDVEGHTQHLMNEWTKSVIDCLRSYEAQVEQINGGLDDLQQSLRKLQERLG